MPFVLLTACCLLPSLCLPWPGWGRDVLLVLGAAGSAGQAGDLWLTAGSVPAPRAWPLNTNIAVVQPPDLVHHHRAFLHSRQARGTNHLQTSALQREGAGGQIILSSVF